MLDDETQQPENGDPSLDHNEIAEDGADAQEAPGEPVAEGAPVEEAAAPRRSRRQRTGRSEGGGRAAGADVPTKPAPAPRLLDRYRAEIVPAMIREFGYSNSMEVPRLQKIVLNIGLGEALTTDGQWRPLPKTWPP